MYPWALAYQYSCSIRSTVITHPSSLSPHFVRRRRKGQWPLHTSTTTGPRRARTQQRREDAGGATPCDRRVCEKGTAVPGDERSRESTRSRHRRERCDTAPDTDRGDSDANTMVRFSRDEIYTFVGSVLLAVNPYKPIPMLYGEDVMMAFESGSLVDAPPHMYALVESSYRRAIHGGGSQSLIISGESGAGKTVSTKLALSYLVWRTRREAKGDLSASASFMKCILQANPLMEAFGNVRRARPSYTHRARR